MILTWPWHNPALAYGEAIVTYEKTMLPRATDAARILEHGAEALLERHDSGEIAGFGPPQH